MSPFSPIIEAAASAKAAKGSRGCWSRRSFLTAAAASWPALKAQTAVSAPTSAVAIAPCKTYGPELLPTLEKMMDQLGGLSRLVRNKTVAVKINLTGAPSYRLGHDPAELRHWTHWAVIGSMIHLLDKAGAQRVRLLESPWNTADPLEEYILEAGWDPADLLNAGRRVEMENTNWLGSGARYSRFTVPGRGHMFPAFDLNHSYEDCDVFVSIAKMKEHATAGITLSMKNCFGITPHDLRYGRRRRRTQRLPAGGRDMFHSGLQPSPAPRRRTSIVAAQGVIAFPYRVAISSPLGRHLAVIDGIRSMTGEEVADTRQARLARVLIAGLNPVTTDAAARPSWLRPYGRQRTRAI
jgi:hypothetical protein